MIVDLELQIPQIRAYANKRKQGCNSRWRYSCVPEAIRDTSAVTNQGPTVTSTGDIAVTAVGYTHMIAVTASEALEVVAVCVSELEVYSCH